MKAQSSHAFMDVEMLKDLREHARVFLKLDFVYLAALGAAIAALKLGRDEIIEMGGEWSYFGYGFILLVCFDTFVYSLIFNEWFSASTGTGNRKPAILFKFLLNLQTFIHLNFVAIVVVVAFSEGNQDARTGFFAKVLIQEDVELYMEQTGSPKTLNELLMAKPGVQKSLNKLDGEEVKIEATGPKSYKITYAGRDKIWGTNDDEITTQDLRLRQVWDRVERDRKGVGAQK